MNEPLNEVYYFGAERQSDQYLERDPIPDLTFANVKAMCEQPFEGKVRIAVTWNNVTLCRDSNLHVVVNVHVTKYFNTRIVALFI